MNMIECIVKESITTDMINNIIDSIRLCWEDDCNHSLSNAQSVSYNAYKQAYKQAYILIICGMPDKDIHDITGIKQGHVLKIKYKVQHMFSYGFIRKECESLSSVLNMSGESLYHYCKRDYNNWVCEAIRDTVVNNTDVSFVL